MAGHLSPTARLLRLELDPHESGLSTGRSPRSAACGRPNTLPSTAVVQVSRRRRHRGRDDHFRPSMGDQRAQGRAGRWWRPTVRRPAPTAMGARSDGTWPHRARPRLDIATGVTIVSGLRYAFGACAFGEELLVSESWRHRVVAITPKGRRRVVLDNLPVYPSRISLASSGGFWLTAFAARTQLVEFVLREAAYRRRMMAEIDPQYWIAPKLRSGQSFLEPMQGAHIKTMGISHGRRRDPTVS